MNWLLIRSFINAFIHSFIHPSTSSMTHSLTHSLTHSFTHSPEIVWTSLAVGWSLLLLTNSLIHSLIRSLPPPPPPPPPPSLTYSLAHSFTHSLTHSPQIIWTSLAVGWSLLLLTNSLIHSLIRPLPPHSFTHSLTHSLAHSFTHSFIHSLTHLRSFGPLLQKAGLFCSYHNPTDRMYLLPMRKPVANTNGCLFNIYSFSYMHEYQRNG